MLKPNGFNIYTVDIRRCPLERNSQRRIYLGRRIHCSTQKKIEHLEKDEIVLDEFEGELLKTFSSILRKIPDS
jgi:hypothetical protein